MQGEFSSSKNVAQRTRGWSDVAAIPAVASGLAGSRSAGRGADQVTRSSVSTMREQDALLHDRYRGADQVPQRYPWSTMKAFSFTRLRGLSWAPIQSIVSSTCRRARTSVDRPCRKGLRGSISLAYEGPVYYALNTPATGSEDLYRFFNTRTGAHFYTTSAPERDHVKVTWPWFAYEGVAYQVFADVNSGGGGGGPGTSTTALVICANPAAMGASVTFMATVAWHYADRQRQLHRQRRGDYRLHVDGTRGQRNVGTAACTTAALTVGSHTVVAF